MTERQRNYTAISRAAWGYVLCHVGFNLGKIDVLPDFIGYLLLLSVIEQLKEEQKSLTLLRPFGWILTVWSGLDWLGVILGLSASLQLPLVILLLQMVRIYFHFQFLTDLAVFAESCGDIRWRWKGHGPPSRELIKNRNRQTVLLTVLSVLAYLPQPQVVWWQYVMLLPTIAVLVIIIDILIALFDLRKLFRPLPPAEKKPS